MRPRVTAFGAKMPLTTSLTLRSQLSGGHEREGNPKKTSARVWPISRESEHNIALVRKIHGRKNGNKKRSRARDTSEPHTQQL